MDLDKTVLKDTRAVKSDKKRTKWAQGTKYQTKLTKKSDSMDKNWAAQTKLLKFDIVMQNILFTIYKTESDTPPLVFDI